MILSFVILMLFELTLMLFFIRTARIHLHPEEHYSDLDKELMKSFRRFLGKSGDLPPLQPNRFSGCMMLLGAGIIGLLVLLDIFFIFRYLITGHF